VMQHQTRASLSDEAASGGRRTEQNRIYLRMAVENGMMDLVCKLLTEGVRPEAAEFGDLLLLCGPLPDKQIGAGIAKALLESVATGAGPLLIGAQAFAAAEAGWSHLLDVMLQHASLDYDWQDPQGRTGVFVACQARHLDCLVALLNAGADPSLADHTGTSPLMASCNRNHCAAVGALLAAGSPVLGSSRKRNSALILCCRVGHPEILEMLLKHARRSDGQVKVQDELQRLCALHVAAECDRPCCIRVLLDHGADTEALTSEAHSTPCATALHVASLRAHSCSVAALLDGGAKVDARDGQGRTPLHVAVQQGHLLMVRLLRTYGADTHAEDASGKVPSYYCLRAEGETLAALRAELVDPALEFLLAVARRRSDEACEVLRFAGLPGLLPVRRCVDVDSGDHWTPLLEAVTCGNLPFACALVRVGADPRRTDKHGLSPLFWAQVLHGHDAVAALAAQQPQQTPSLVDVQCKDGFLRVTRAASEWMEAHFPAVAAASVPCATLALTLKAQGLESTAPQTSGQPFQGHFDANETAALARLEAARRRDVRDAMLLEMRFEQTCWEHGKPDHQVSHLQAMMQLAPAPALVTGEARSPCAAEAILQTHAGSTVDLLRVPGDSTALSQKALARARHAAIGVAASASRSSSAGLGMQQLLLLHLLRYEKSFLEEVNASLVGGGRSSEHWAPFAASALDAVQALPVAGASEVVYCSPGGSFDAAAHRVGEVLSWPAFVVVTQDSVILSSRNPVLLYIKTHSVRLLSGVFGDESFGILLPGARFRTTSMKYQVENKNKQSVRVDLEELPSV